MVGIGGAGRPLRHVRLRRASGSPRAPATATASCSPPGSPRWSLVQALVNLLAVFGLAPLTGVPLPFVSYGNASMLVMLAAVGLLLNISRGGSARLGAPSRRAAVGDCASSTAPRRPNSRRSARVVIAAGGTAGHVVPALAVADALRAEGAEVTFLGAADRAEARSSRRPATRSTCCAFAASTARNPLRRGGSAATGGRRGAGGEAGPARARRPGGARRRRLRRRAGRASRRPRCGLPLVLTEADRHLGLTNRMLARRARRVCLAFPIEGRTGPRYLVTGRPVPAAIGARRPRRGPGAVRDRRRRPLPARLRRQPGRAVDQPRARSRRSPGPAPPAATSTSSTSAAAATTPRSASTPRGGAEPRPLHAARVRARARRRARRLGPRARPRRRLDLRDRRREAPRDPGPVSARDRRPPARERALDGRRRARRVVRRGRRARSRAPAASSSASCSATRSGSSGWPPPRRALARPDAAERIASELLSAIGKPW